MNKNDACREIINAKEVLKNSTLAALAGSGKLSKEEKIEISRNISRSINSVLDVLVDKVASIKVEE